MRFKTCNRIAAIGYVSAFAIALTARAATPSLGTAEWTQVSPGGGGRLMYPAIDPADPNTLLCGSDMGTAYRSQDNGATWRVFPWTELNAVSGSGLNGRGSWAFDPALPGSVWVGTSTGFYRSTDHGEHWSRITGPWETASAPKPGPSSISFATNKPGHMVAAFSVAWFVSGAFPEAQVYASNDSGSTWTPTAKPPLAAKELVRSVFFDPTTADGILLIGQHTLARSSDSGRSWTTLPTEAFPKDADGTLTIMDASLAGEGTSAVIYLTTAVAVDKNAQTASCGIFRSTDGGRTWAAVAGSGLELTVRNGKPPFYNLIQACSTKPERVYAGLIGYRDLGAPTNPGHANLYRSDDGGQTWTPVLFQHPQMPQFNVIGTSWTIGQWGWASSLCGLSVDQANPDRVLVTTINGSLLTVNGGKTWRIMHSGPKTDAGNASGGMAIMSAWRYAFDPHDTNHQFISMTDFGGWMSQDGAKTWTRYEHGNPWPENIYAVAFDPKTPGRVWAACSAMHDIPFYRYLAPMLSATGGVAKSEDGGKTWTKAAVDKSLPSAAMTDLTLLPGENGGSDTLFVAAMGHGMYASTDGGQTWKPSVDGFDKNNKAFLRVTATSDRKLLALTTMYQKGTAITPGALYASTDTGRTWKKIFQRDDAAFPVNVWIDPHDSRRIGLSVMGKTPYSDDGGIWRSDDGGVTWTRTAAGTFWGGGFSPTRPGRVYATSFRTGLKVSDDGGQTWWTDGSFPTWRPTGVYFDPTRPTDLYVTAFGGGVWRIDESTLTNSHRANKKP